MALALSTSWNAFRQANARDLVLEIKGLGFTHIELSFNLTPALVDGISELVEAKQISVSSLHNFCPIPDGVPRSLALPDYYSLASLDENQRKKAVEQTKKTISTASRLHARAVVLHSGRVEIPDRTRELITLYTAGKKDIPEFLQLRDDIVRQRAQAAPAHLENTIKSLKELNRFAAEKNILLGIETRFYYREIPNLDEVGLILEQFKYSQILYWHDSGHARLMRDLGFIADDEEFLRRYSQRMLGIHVHDIVNCDDHRAPGTGEIDFKRFADYISVNTIKVIEAHHPANAAAIRESKNYLEAVWDGKI